VKNTSASKVVAFFTDIHFLRKIMTRFKYLLLAFMASNLIFTACSATKKAGNDADLLQLVDWMSGDFSSQAQSLRDSAFFDIRLHIRPIWKSDKANHWLYVEQATAAAQNRPYRQRVYKVERAPDGGFRSVVYLLPDEKKYINAYQTPEKFDELKPADLLSRTGCTVFLKKQSDGTFAGATHESDCESNLRGAKYATSKVTVNSKMLLSWDQGFDAEGKQVWGAVKGGYEFLKQ
jgi:CpeT protein